MKSMKLSAIVLGLAAAGALAQESATEVAAPAEQAVAEAQPVETVQPAEAQSAAEPAEQAATEQAAPTPEAPKAEEAAPAEVAKVEAKTEEPKAEEPKAESTTIAGIEITKADAAPEATKAMEFKVSGSAEFDAYAYWQNDSDKDLTHDYSSTLDVDFQVKFNENWSAQVELEADDASTDPGAIYNGAFVQYTKGENFTLKFGDLAFAEGAFNYYDYSDAGDYAVGMVEHDIRGFELDLYGLQLGLGFTTGTDDEFSDKSYDAHVAYQLEAAGQTFRPFAHYRSWQTAKSNELHAGLDAALEFGPFGIHAAYGLHADNLTEDEPNMTHAVLAEPSFKVSNVNVKAGVFYAYFNDEAPTVHGTEIPEYMFGYLEGDVQVNDALTVGVLCEGHTNSLEDDSDLGTVNFGTRIYFSPVDGLDVTGFAMAIFPLGDDWEKADHKDLVSTTDYGEDLNLKFGVETVFSF